MKQITGKGFTLLELLVVVVIFTLISVVVAQVFFTTMRSNNKTEIVREVKQNGDRAMEIITRLVQNAKFIQLPSSCPERPLVGETIDSVSLTNFDGGQTILACEVKDGIARIASTSASQTVYLMNTNVTLIDPVDKTNACTNHALAFTCTSVGDTPSYITIGFSLRQKNSSASVVDTASETFQTTVTLRNK